ncbi:helix-turn-helix domain-containing protein [Mycobacterium sp. NPDC050041]|uniref:helix-turn-helix domain-containing protein n=1 Tax=Mycobacterium sp. NPDC050041 TaxID=3364293 RepID=UPI003C2B6E5B
MTVPQTYSLAEAARLMGCTERWLADQLRARRFPGRKICRQWRMTDADIEAATDACREAPVGERVVSAMTATSRKRLSA